MTDTIRDHRIGVIGVGNMGGAVARSMIRGGFDVVVFDGASAAASVAALVGQCRWVSVVVVNDAQVNEVGGAVVGLAQPGTIVAIHSTVRPSTVVALAELGSKRGVEVIDVAVNGGNEKANLGLLTLMIGGDERPINYAWPLLESFGAHIFHIGPVGSGLVGKLVNNLIALGSYALQLEAVQLAAAYGVDEDTVATIVSYSQGDNRGMRTWGRHDRKRRERRAQGTDWTWRMGRDLDEAAIAAGAMGIPLPLTAVAAQAMPYKLRERDRYLDSLPPAAPIPLCTVCDSELAPPFRVSGLHPECVDG
jgi:3-hydroxyisobutyrate dehydrogenase